MFAVVTIAGQQFKVEEGQELFVHQLAAAEGDQVTFDQVHLLANENAIKVGKPNIDSAKIEATVLGRQKSDKVVVFKKKRRKGYKVRKGHRQRFSKIKIDSITG